MNKRITFFVILVLFLIIITASLFAFYGNKFFEQNPEEILTKNALTQPHITVINRDQVEQSQIHQLSIALKQHLLTEIRET